MTVRDSDVFPTTPHHNELHTPFLHWAASDESGDVGLAAFLTLRLVDVLASGGLDSPATCYQIDCTHKFLDDLRPETDDVRRLKDIVQAAGAARELNDPRLVWPPVVTFALWLEDESRLEQALDALDTALALSDGRDGRDEVLTYLQRGRVLLLCSRPQEALLAYVDAETMATCMGESEEASALLACVGRGAALRGLNELSQAERVLDGVIQDAGHQGHAHAEVLACRELAFVYMSTRRRPEAAVLMYRAVIVCVNLRDKGLVLCDLGAMLQEFGWNDAAQCALGIVAGNDFEPRQRIRAMLGLLELTALTDNRIGFEAWKNGIQSLTDDLRPEQLVGFHSSLGEGYWRFGQPKKATQQLESAIELARVHGLYDEQVRAESMLVRVSGGESLADETITVEYSEDQGLLGVAERLRGLGTQPSHGHSGR